MRPRVNLVAVVVLAAACPILVGSCDGTPVSGVTCGADLSATDAGRKVDLFVKTSNALVIAANQIDADMLDVCTGMAHDLGIPAAEIAPPVGMETAAGARTRMACTRVKTEIDTIIKNDVPTEARLAIVYTPAVCTVDAEAETLCVQQCEPKTVTVTRLMCTPGHAYVQCAATCTGTCGGSCTGMCVGQCTGTCSGTCEGNCNGACMGTCSAKNADGSCYGKCTGTCMGTCDAKCTGNCSASCNGSCSATCTGGCEGDCTGSVVAPKCTEVQEQVMVDDCHTTCQSKAKFEAVCTEPSLVATFGVTPHKPSVDKLVLAVKNHYAKLLKVAVRTGVTIGDSSGKFVTALSGVGDYASQVSASAAACVLGAVSAVGAAATQVEVSASFSVSISASVTANGSATAM
jgi:hypothetical protein